MRDGTSGEAQGSEYARMNDACATVRETLHAGGGGATGTTATQKHKRIVTNRDHLSGMIHRSTQRSITDCCDLLMLFFLFVCVCVSPASGGASSAGSSVSDAVAAWNSG